MPVLKKKKARVETVAAISLKLTAQDRSRLELIAAALERAGVERPTHTEVIRVALSLLSSRALDRPSFVAWCAANARFAL